ncbi:MAG: hypothetical protein ACOY3P_16395 [Planctomycetota bacterium]
MKNIAPACVLSLAALLSVALAVEPNHNALYRGTLMDLAPAPSVLGEKWVSATGLVVEDFADLESHPAEIRPAVESLKKQLEPLGIRKVADFSFRVPDDPSHFVTLRVFVFDTPESCSRWWATKYRHEGWEKFYKPVENAAYAAVDSTEAPKRAAALGNVWMTCHALKDTDNHVAVMEACVEKLLEASKSE